MDYTLDLYNTICEVINNNPSLISTKYFILKDIFKEVENIYYQYLQEVNKQQQQFSVSESIEEKIEVPCDISIDNE